MFIKATLFTKNKKLLVAWITINIFNNSDCITGFNLKKNYFTSNSDGNYLLDKLGGRKSCNLSCDER